MGLHIQRKQLRRFRLLSTLIAVLAFVVQSLVSLNLPAAFAVDAQPSITPTSHALQGGGITASQATSTISGAGYKDMKVSFHYNVKYLDKDEKFEFGISGDDATNQIVTGVSGNNNDSEEADAEINVPAAYNNSTFTVYFKDNGNTSGTTGNHDAVSVKNLVVSGSVISAPVDITAPSVPSATLKDTNNKTITNGYIATKQFTFKLTNPVGDGVNGYHIKYWNDINGSPYQSESNAWSTTRGADGVYADQFTQGEGAHYFAFSACDVEGNCSNYSSPFKVTYDQTAPTAAITAPTENELVSGSITVRATASDDNGLGAYCLKIDSGSCVSGGYVYQPANGNMKDVTVNTENLSDGTHTLIARVTDKAGNDYEYSRHIVVDNTAPVITVNINDGALLRTTKTLTMTLTDEAHPKTYNIRILDEHGQPIQVNGHNLGTYDANHTVNTYSYDFDTTKVIDGIYKIQFSARDAAENSATTIYRTVRVDNTPPEITSVTYSPSTWTKDKVEVTITAKEAVQPVAGWSLSSDAKTLTRDYTANVNDGVVVKDIVGNETTVPIKITWIDTTDPSVTLTASVTGTTNQTVTVTRQASDDASFDYYKYCVMRNGVKDADCDTKVSNALNDTVSYNKEGSYEISLVAYDKAGNTSSSTLTFTIDKTAPVVTVDDIPNAIKSGQALTLTGTTDDPMASVTVTLNGVTYSLAPTGTANWSLDLAGTDTAGLEKGKTYIITVVAADTLGNTSAPVQTNLSVSAPVTSSLDLPGRGGLIAPGVTTSGTNGTGTPNATPSTANDDTAVLGTKDDSGKAPADTTASVVKPSEQGWKVLGLAWYWWLLILAALAAAWWWFAAARRRAEETA